MVEIYVDILILLNFVVDFFMLNLTAKISNSTVKTKRIILGSVFASLFSLYIFLPPLKFWFEFVLRTVSSLIIVLFCFGFKNIKMFLKRFFVFYLISFIFAGVMIAIWLLFKPKTMAINNGIVYFNFSPVVFLISTTVCYLSLLIFRNVFATESSKAKRVKITAYINNNSVSFVSAVDTGNSLRDPISNTPVIVADKKIIMQLTREEYGKFINGNSKTLSDRYRIIPIKTVGGGGLLAGIKCDYVKYNNFLVENTIIAESKTSFTDDYSAVLNPEILEV